MMIEKQTGLCLPAQIAAAMGIRRGPDGWRSPRCPR